MTQLREPPKQFVCAHQGILFKILFLKDCEHHIFKNKDDPTQNWEERCPLGTSKWD